MGGFKLCPLPRNIRKNVGNKSPKLRVKLNNFFFSKPPPKCFPAFTPDDRQSSPTSRPRASEYTYMEQITSQNHSIADMANVTTDMRNPLQNELSSVVSEKYSTVFMAQMTTVNVHMDEKNSMIMN